MLEKEEKNENAEFHVKEVQYIQAEVCPLDLYDFASFISFSKFGTQTINIIGSMAESLDVLDCVFIFHWYNVSGKDN